MTASQLIAPYSRRLVGSAGALRGLALLLAVVALVGLRATAAEGDDSYQINVRSTVDRPFKGLGKEPLREHGKVYAIVSIKQIENLTDKLARPVNEYALLKNLNRVLAAHGFHEAIGDTKPEILFTVLYGRGWLNNPYLDDGVVDELSGGIYGYGSSSFGIPVVTIVGVPKDIIRHKEAGYEEKLQRANSEKLILNITTWEPPAPRKSGTKKQKPKRLWYTTINTDDADQDLNQQMAKMLEAGAVYFDHEIDKEEITVSSDTPEGHVKVGTPTVAEPGLPRK